MYENNPAFRDRLNPECTLGPLHTCTHELFHIFFSQSWHKGLSMLAAAAPAHRTHGLCRVANDSFSQVQGRVLRWLRGTCYGVQSIGRKDYGVNSLTRPFFFRL